MDVNETVSRYSDLSFGTALTVYVLAMVIYLAALASRRQVVEKSDELVGARAGSGGTIVPEAGGSRVPGKLNTVARVQVGDRLAGMAYGAVVAGPR